MGQTVTERKVHIMKKVFYSNAESEMNCEEQNQEKPTIENMFLFK